MKEKLRKMENFKKLPLKEVDTLDLNVAIRAIAIDPTEYMINLEDTKNEIEL